MQSKVKPYQPCNFTNRIISSSEFIPNNATPQFQTALNLRYQLPKYISPETTRAHTNSIAITTTRQQPIVGQQSVNWVSRPEPKQALNFRTSLVGPIKTVSSNVPVNSNLGSQNYTNHYNQSQNGCSLNNPIYFKSPQQLTPNSSVRNLKDSSPLNQQQNFQTPKTFPYATPQSGKETVTSNNSSYYSTQSNFKKQTSSVSDSSISNPATISQFEFSKTFNGTTQNCSQYNAFNNDCAFNYFEGIKKDRQVTSNKYEKQVDKFDKFRNTRNKNNDIFKSQDTIKSQNITNNNIQDISITNSQMDSSSVQRYEGKSYQKADLSDIYSKKTGDKNTSPHRKSLQALQEAQMRNQQLSNKIGILQSQLSTFKNNLKQCEELQQIYKQTTNKNNMQILQLKVQLSEAKSKIQNQKALTANYKQVIQTLKSEKNELNKKILQVKSQQYKQQQNLRKKLKSESSKYEKEKEQQKQNEVKLLMEIKLQLDNYISINKQLEKKLQQQQVKVIDLNYSLTQSNLAITKFKEENTQAIQKYKGTVNSIKIENHRLASQIASKTVTIQALKIQIENKKVTIDKYQQEFKKQINQLLQKNKNLQILNNEKQSIQKELKNQVIRLEQEFRNADQRWKHQYTGLNSKYESQFKLKNQENKNDQHIICQQNERIKVLQSQSNSICEKIKLLQNQNKHLKEQIKLWQNQNKHLKILENQNKAVNEKVKLLQNENKNLKQLEKQNKFFNDKIKISENQFKSANEKIYYLEKQIQDIKKQILLSETQNKGLKQSLKILENQNRIGSDRIKVLQSESKNIYEKVKLLQNENKNLKQLEKQNKFFNDKIKISENQFKSANEKIYYLEKQLQDVNKNIILIQSLNKSLKQSLNHFENQNISGNEKIRILFNENKNLKEQVKCWENQNRSLKITQSQVIDKVRQLQNYNQNLIHDISQSKRQLQNIKMQKNIISENEQTYEKKYKQMIEQNVCYKQQIQKNKHKSQENILTLQKQVQNLFIKQNYLRQQHQEQLKRNRHQYELRQKQIILHFQNQLKGKQLMIAQLSQRTDRSSLQVTRVVEQLTKYRNESHSLKVEVEQLKKILQEKHKQSCQLISVAQQKQQQQRKWNQEKQKMANQIQNLINELNYIRQLHQNEIQAMNNHYQQNIQCLQNQLNCQCEEIQYMQKVRDQLKQNNSQLIEANQKLNLGNQILSSENQSLMKTLNLKTQQLANNNHLYYQQYNSKINFIFELLNAFQAQITQKFSYQNCIINNMKQKIQHVKQFKKSTYATTQINNSRTNQLAGQQLNALFTFFQDKCKDVDFCLLTETDSSSSYFKSSFQHLDQCQIGATKQNKNEIKSCGMLTNQQEKRIAAIVSYVQKLEEQKIKNNELDNEIKKQKKQRNALSKQVQKLNKRIIEMEENVYRLQQIIQQRNRMIDASEYKVRDCQIQLQKQEELSSYANDVIIASALDKLNIKYKCLLEQQGWSEF